MDQKPGNKITVVDALMFLGIGFELITFTLALGYLGYYIDQKNKTFPIFSLSGFTLGLALWIVHFFRLSRKYFK